MAKADVEMLRRAYAAFDEDGLGAVQHLLDEEFEMRVPPDGPFAALGPFHGTEGWERLLAERDEAFAEVGLFPERFIDLGERVLVLGSQTARGREGGVARLRTIPEPVSWLVVAGRPLDRTVRRAGRPRSAPVAGWRAGFDACYPGTRRMCATIAPLRCPPFARAQAGGRTGTASRRGSRRRHLRLRCPGQGVACAPKSGHRARGATLPPPRLPVGRSGRAS